MNSAIDAQTVPQISAGLGWLFDWMRWTPAYPLLAACAFTMLIFGLLYAPDVYKRYRPLLPLLRTKSPFMFHYLVAYISASSSGSPVDVWATIGSVLAGVVAVIALHLAISQWVPRMRRGGMVTGGIGAAAQARQDWAGRD